MSQNRPSSPPLYVFRSSAGSPRGRLLLPLVLAAALLLDAGSARAVGVGVLVGTREPELALSLKSGLGPSAVDLAFSWSSGIYLHADYLLHFTFLSRKVPLYLGLGGALELDQETRLGMRIPLGICLLLSQIELFFEVVPQVRLVPELARDWMDPNLGLGARLHFR